MPISPYLAGIRARIGHDLLLTPTISAVVFDDCGAILMLRHVDGDTWGPVGGFIEPDETPEDTATREVAEETGLVVTIAGLIGVYGGADCRTTYNNGDEIAFVSTCFGCRLQAGTLGLEMAEVLEAGWFGPDSIYSLHRQPWTERALRDAFAWWNRGPSHPC